MMPQRFQRDYWPTTGWREARPEEHGMEAVMLGRLEGYMKAVPPFIRALLIVRHGYLVFERYAQGNHAGQYHMLRSATKTVTSALMGMALREGVIKSLDQHLDEFFPEYFSADIDPRKRQMTLGHLLTMTSGFSPDSVLEQMYFTQEVPQDFVKCVIQSRMWPNPGEQFAYCSLGSHLLSVLLTRKAHMSTLDFARRHLFAPLGIATDAQAGFAWGTDPQGDYKGNAELLLQPRDMAKFGYLYLNAGQWEDKQLLPAAYVKKSVQAHSRGGPPEAEGYGYLWRVTAYKNHPTYFAAGAGGQFICVIPDLDLVVVIASSVNGGLVPGRHHRQYILPLFVIPAIRA